MGSRQGPFFVDSGPFILDLSFPQDPRAAITKRFLERLRLRGSGVTSWVNLLEVGGSVSFHSQPERTKAVVDGLSARYRIRLWPERKEDFAVPFDAVLDRLSRRMKFGDALVLWAAEECKPRVRTLVTWNSDDFEGRTALAVRTPQQVLRGL